ncbi:30S ribosomal protein S8 [Wolbachia endosymbiont of Pentidionis agamae]|uniref:30S ribosomal protein S8 n=1 Tax=Wolbachia endosymbiont of Pentidionis agamae TaxID=3110435 RepID=UPI002FD77622
MALSDSIGDFITRIRNAQLAMHKKTKVLFSKINLSILGILKEEGYIVDYSKESKGNVSCLIVKLKYYNNSPVVTNIARVSKPGQRYYCKSKNVNKFYNGLGIFILSTSKGIMTDYSARELKVGGEVLCSVF